jgi:hypothetical protein
MTFWTVEPKDLAVGHLKFPWYQTKRAEWKCSDGFNNELDRVVNGHSKHPMKRIIHSNRFNRNFMSNFDRICPP